MNFFVRTPSKYLFTSPISAVPPILFTYVRFMSRIRKERAPRKTFIKNVASTNTDIKIPRLKNREWKPEKIQSKTHNNALRLNRTGITEKISGVQISDTNPRVKSNSSKVSTYRRNNERYVEPSRKREAIGSKGQSRHSLNDKQSSRSNFPKKFGTDYRRIDRNQALFTRHTGSRKLELRERSDGTLEYGDDNYFSSSAPINDFDERKRKKWRGSTNLLPKPGKRGGIDHAERAKGRGKGWAQNDLIERIKKMCGKGQKEEILKAFLEFKLGRNLRMYEAVLESLCKLSEWSKAIDIFKMIKDEDFKPGQYAYTLVMRASTKLEDYDRTLELHNEMIESGVAPTVYTYTEALKSSQKEKRQHNIPIILEEMRKKGLHPDAYILSTAMTGLANAGKWKESVELLNTYPDNSVQVYGAAINACAKAGQYEQAIDILDKMKNSKHVQPDQRCYTAAMLACARCGKWEEAENLLKETVANGWIPSSFTRNTAMDACGKAGQWEKVLDMLQTWYRQGSKSSQLGPELSHNFPNVVSYGIAIDACGKAGKSSKAIELLETMKTRGIQPTEIAYGAAMEALAKSKEWTKAIDLYDQIKVDGIAPNKAIRSSFFKALRSGGIEGEDVLESFLVEEKRELAKIGKVSQVSDIKES